jgi:hypothetical protein
LPAASTIAPSSRCMCVRVSSFVILSLVCTSLACLADAQVDRNPAELGRSLHREGAGTYPSHHHNVVAVE